jgi:prolyl oligopeptidase PreP (S9A serine peptidase family)
MQGSGDLRSVLPLPGIGSVNGFSGQRKHSQAFFKFTSFTEPGAIYRCESTPHTHHHHSHLQDATHFNRSDT